MHLGRCCHCSEVSSASSSSSLALSTFSRSGIGASCRCPVLPIRWSISVPGPQSSGFVCSDMCNLFYTGTFTLSLTSFNSGSCIARWDSEEKAVNANSASCATVTDSRFSLEYSDGGSPGSVIFRLYARHEALGLKQAVYENVVSGVIQPHNCLARNTLSYSTSVLQTPFCKFNGVIMPSIDIVPA